MTRVSWGRAFAAALLGGAGATMLVVGFVETPSLRFAALALGPPVAWQLVGGALLAASLVVARSALRSDAAPAPSVPAHVSFVQRQSQPLPSPAPRPARPSVEPARSAGEETIDAQIRDVTRRINRAGVMLGTGQLSEAGYAKLVADLKEKRGALEAERVQREMSGKR